MDRFRWTFDVAGDAAFDRLAAAVAELRGAKLSGDWRDGAYWRRVFSGATIDWGVDELVDAFEAGEFVLVGVRRDDLGTAALKEFGVEPLDRGHLDFEPFACPYSGDCMGQLIEAFGHRVVDSGPA
jgi:hypothetical protein